MRVKIKNEGPGIHPNELVISVPTKEGPEKMVVHRRSIHDNAIEIGYPIAQDGDFYLIELPRETMRGLWRVWVASQCLTESRERRIA